MEVIADFVEMLGAPHDLVVDWIIMMDNPELFEGIDSRRRKAVLKAAKKETARRYIALRVEDAVTFVEMDDDPPEHADLDALKKAAVLADIDDVVESTNFLRAHRAKAIQSESYRRIRDKIGREHAGGDCFDEDVRTQYLRIAADELPELFGSRAARGEIVDRMGLVYLISLGDAGLVKIGFTTKIEHRLRAFRTATPGAITVHLTIEGPRSLEARLHRRFDVDHAGREWFRLSDEIRAFIEAEKAKLDK